MSDNTINFTNQGNASIYGKQVGIDKQYNYNSEQQKTLAEAAQEIQDLLNQLEKSYSTKTISEQELGKKLAKIIDQNPSLKKRIFSAIKSGSLTALQEVVDNPAFNIASAFLQGFSNP